MVLRLILRLVPSAVVFLLLMTAALAVGNAMPGAQLAFLSYKDINPDIYLADVSRGLIQNLTAHPGYDAGIAWSPDGQQLAFISDRDRGPRVYIMHGIGGRVSMVTPVPGNYFGMRWSADGTQLTFYRQQGVDRPALYSVSRDGTGLREIAQEIRAAGIILMELGIENQPSHIGFSPDGRQIALLRFENRRWGIYVADPDRRNPRYLISVGRASDTPSWSPDGTTIAYISTDGGTSDVYVIDWLGRAQPLRLTADRAYEAAPVWRPAGAAVD